MAVLFVSDTHFLHQGIIRAMRRPFASIEEHDEALIFAWNAVVRPRDTVYHLGDFALGPAEEAAKIFGRLAGRKCLIAGNHDTKSRRLPWAEQHDGIREISVDHTHIILCHYPMRSWARAFRGSLHLYGHVHARLPGTTQSQDVGVDAWAYRPVTLAEIRERMALSDVEPEEIAIARARPTA